MLSPTATVQHDAQGFDGVAMMPVSSKDIVSHLTMQTLLRESAAPAFIGEDSSLVSNPTCTNIQAYSYGSELEPRGDHVER